MWAVPTVSGCLICVLIKAYPWMGFDEQIMNAVSNTPERGVAMEAMKNTFVCTDGDVTVRIPKQVMYRAFMLQGMMDEFGMGATRFVRIEEGAKLFGVGRQSFTDLMTEAGALIKWQGIMFADVDRICGFLDTCREE